MKSLSKLIEEVIDDTPFVRESLSEGLINTSALARKIKPELEGITKKTIKESTIVMAISRLPLSKQDSIKNKIKNIVGGIGDFVVRSNLTKYTYKNYQGISANQAVFLKKIESVNDSFYTVSRGINETTLIVNAQLSGVLEENMDKNELLSMNKNLSAITLKLPSANVQTEGVYYFILRKLAWKSISLEEVISTTNEFTIVVQSSVVSKAFEVLANLNDMNL
ncbi:aspartate kinase [Putridiphycobacter roseus]|uniref:Aspartate kinase n=1 Tax=Putridiphycobacter roseus TaxID=2219161 RepID=A0A2W1NQJ0_9FLAO|nr:aspartate kinase [Putridiphycobacter roseus]PZE17912.1 aspartate kinase [Putridiphycobacter roseus]